MYYRFHGNRTLFLQDRHKSFTNKKQYSQTLKLILDDAGS
jgi:hypothetical protein